MVKGVNLDENVREARQQAFLDAFLQTGVQAEACRATGISYSTVKQWRRLDAEFKEAMETALQIAVDEAVLEVRERGVHGKEELILYKGEPVPKRNADGELVLDENFEPVYWTRTVRSDRLLELYVKAHRQEFREKGSLEVSGPNGEGIPLNAAVEVTFVDPATAPQSDETPAEE